MFKKGEYTCRNRNSSATPLNSALSGETGDRTRVITGDRSSGTCAESIPFPPHHSPADLLPLITNLSEQNLPPNGCPTADRLVMKKRPTEQKTPPFGSLAFSTVHRQLKADIPWRCARLRFISDTQKLTGAAGIPSLPGILPPGKSSQALPIGLRKRSAVLSAHQVH